MEDMLTE